MLRAICWKTDTRIGHCAAITDEDLSYLTGYTGRQTFTSARKRLKSLGLIAYEHENKARDQKHADGYGTSNAYMYFVRCGKDGTCPTER